MGTFSITTDTDITTIANKTGLRSSCTFERLGTIATVTDSNHNLIAGSSFYIKANSQAGNAATWTRVAAVATVTFTGHGLALSSQIRVTASSATGTIALGTKTVTGAVGDTFTFACTNAGALSGTLTYENTWITDSSYAVTAVGTAIVAGVSWTRSSSTITVTSVAHGMVGAGNTIYLVNTSDTSAVPLGAETITYIGADSFSFTGGFIGGLSGTLSYIRTNNLSSAPSTFVATALNSGTNYTGTVDYTSADVYNISGGATLTIDSDSRYGLNQTTYTGIGGITLTDVSSRLLIDGRYVRLIPYDTGSGTLPAMDSTVTQGSASGKIIGVWSSLTSAPTTSGSIPASGWIKIREWNGVAFAAGALTLSGITANATGADTVGWIDLAMVSIRSITASSTSTRIEVLGDWYLLGTTDGTSTTVYQIPNSGQVTFVGGVFVETGSNTNVYEPYPNMGTATTIGTEEARGKVCWIDNTGAVYIGKNLSSTANGYIPPSGRRVVVGNVIVNNTDEVLMTTTVIPSATVTSRYSMTGVRCPVTMSKAVWSCYGSFSSNLSVSVEYSCFDSNVYITNPTGSAIFERIAIGSRAQTELGSVARFAITNCYSPVTITDSAIVHVSDGSAVYGVEVTSVNGLILKNTRMITVSGNRSCVGFSGRCHDLLFDGNTYVPGDTVAFISDSNAGEYTYNADIKILNSVYVSLPSGTTPNSGNTGFASFGNTVHNLTVDGITIGVSGCHPFNTILFFGRSVSNVVLKNVGTRLAPVSRVSGASDSIISLSTNSTTSKNFLIERCYLSDTGNSGFISIGGATYNTNIVKLINCTRTDTNTLGNTSVIDYLVRGCDGLLDLTAQNNANGLIWADTFTTDSGSDSGRIYIKMNDVTDSTSDQVALTGSSIFSGTGLLYMKLVGDTAIYTMPYYAIGHTGFQNTDAVMAGGTITNYTLSYDIDKNDGVGFSGNWTTLSGANLSAISDIDAAAGFKLKIKIETTTGNSDGISSLYIKTTSSATARAYEYVETLDSTPVNIWSLPIEGSVTAAQALRAISAVMVGKSTITSGSPGAATIVFRDVNDTTDRVTATMSSSARTAVTLDVAETESTMEGLTAQDVWNYPIEGTYTAAHLLREIASIAAGKSTITPGDPGEATIVFKALDATTTRASVDVVDSERTAITLTTGADV